MDRVGELYGADLLGAGLGCALAVPLLGVLSPPGCVMLAGLAFVLAALRLAVRSRPLLALAVPLAGLLLLAAILSDRLPDPVPDPVKTMNPLGGPGPMLFSKSSYEWDFTYCAFGSTPAASRTVLSGTPVHCAMADHPSSHVWRVRPYYRSNRWST